MAELYISFTVEVIGASTVSAKKHTFTSDVLGDSSVDECKTGGNAYEHKDEKQ